MANAVNTIEPSFYGPIYDITKEKGNVVLDKADNAGHKVTRVYGYNSVPDHNNLRCVDFMVYNDKSDGDWIVQWLIKNKDKMGVELIIWQRRIWRNYNKPGIPAGTWVKYTGYSPHTDHPHVQFNTAKIKGGLSDGGGTSKPSGGGGAKYDKGGWTGTLHVIKGPVMAYDGTGRQRPEHALKKGETVKGEVDQDPFGDGRYFRKGNKPHSLWYPLDNGNFAHSKNGKAIDKDGKERDTSVKAEPKVSLDKIIKAARRDTDRKQGGTTPGAADDVKVVEAALKAEGFLPAKYSRDGSFGSSSVEAYSKWQKKLGYRGKDADGIPGKASLKKLGAKYDFKVVA